MTSQGHLTSPSLKQPNKEDNREVFFIRLHLKKFCTSIDENSHCKMWDPKQHEVKAMNFKEVHW